MDTTHRKTSSHTSDIKNTQVFWQEELELMLKALDPSLLVIYLFVGVSGVCWKAHLIPRGSKNWNIDSVLVRQQTRKMYRSKTDPGLKEYWAAMTEIWLFKIVLSNTKLLWRIIITASYLQNLRLKDLPVMSDGMTWRSHVRDNVVYFMIDR